MSVVTTLPFTRRHNGEGGGSEQWKVVTTLPFTRRHNKPFSASAV